ncbi:xanthine dehydrogenase family protein molybdopterin-binding subunit [Bacillus sp. B15-48]|uniref:xanthine dehydrogenase family protein molybdopterin-binding subunit n=1 Tax=Bacillus sp. B15-48 TaxID=1548601 RepID=UPI0019401EE9|nr:xanthine dehydrogenase family protein molybdopterin-binding subunit [Bacillus sp. B15-48]MBM4761870.1 molybdopterin-dependent oxidoreductase [Bacillus sp. B15-48]
MQIIGKSVIRQEAWDKVTGRAKYTADFHTVDAFHVEMIKSPYAHARIINIEITKAKAIDGVHAVITGENLPLIGEEVRDRPALPTDRVRYHGEVVVLIVAESLPVAKRAAQHVYIKYDPLPVVNSPLEAYETTASILHENLEQYERDEGIYPEAGTNIINRTKIRKGDISKGWTESDVTVESTFSFPASDHAAMETRSATCEMMPNGDIHIITSSQAPFMVKKIISRDFGIERGKVIVETPLVGGGYGGKASVYIEIFAFLASRAVGGKLVKIVNSREEDIVSSPVHIGMDAVVRLGCSKDGKLRAASLLYLFDGGAYADKSAHISRAGGVDCTGPYYIEHIQCDSLCLYTNHPYASPYRGFSHGEVHFVFERALDMLAEKVNIDPLSFRQLNGVRPGHTTPTQVVLNRSTVGNLEACINQLKGIMNWDEGRLLRIDRYKVRAKGISCVWKNSTIETNASSGVILIFNSDGSINLISGVVEIGTGTKTVLAQMLAEKMRMDIHQIHVRMSLDTQTTPEHWKTVASRGTFMAGRAVLSAAEDAILQLKQIASCVLRVSVEDLDVGYGKVFLRDDPSQSIDIKDIAYGYTFPNGNAIGGQIIAKGTYILRGLTFLDPETGAGKPGPEWAVAAQGVEVEYDMRTYRYEVKKAVTVVDLGKILNYDGAIGQVKGAMSMGLAWAAREGFYYDSFGRVLNSQLRTYRPLRYGEHPEYIVDFVETPQLDAPYGSRGVGEHGVIGMPAALANALSLAAGVPLNSLPLTPEQIWRAKEGKS